MNKLLVVFLILFVLLLLSINLPCGCSNESFYNGPGTGKSFSSYNHPNPPCLAKNNCFRGSYFTN